MLPVFSVTLTTEKERLIFECAANDADEAAEYVSALVLDRLSCSVLSPQMDGDHTIVAVRELERSDSGCNFPLVMRPVKRFSIGS